MRVRSDSIGLDVEGTGAVADRALKNGEGGQLASHQRIEAGHGGESAMRLEEYHHRTAGFRPRFPGDELCDRSGHRGRVR
jgi:hypothetical protein